MLPEGGTPSLCTGLGHPGSQSTSELPQQLSLVKLEAQSLHVAEMKCKTKFQNIFSLPVNDSLFPLENQLGSFLS